MVEFVLKLNTHKKTLALYCALTNRPLIKQASDHGYFWKHITKRTHTALKSLNNQNQMLKVTYANSTKGGKITDYKKKL